MWHVVDNHWHTKTLFIDQTHIGVLSLSEQHATPFQPLHPVEMKFVSSMPRMDEYGSKQFVRIHETGGAGCETVEYWRSICISRVNMLCNQSPSKFWRLLDLDNRDQIDPNWLERSRACCTHKSWSHEIRPQVFHHRACVPEPRLDKPIKWIKRIRGKIQNLDHG